MVYITRLVQCDFHMRWSLFPLPLNLGWPCYLTNRLWQKWHLVTTGLRPWKILQFHNHPLEVSYHVKKSELSCWRGQWREGGPVGWESPIVQLLSRVWLFATPWTAALQPSLSFTISQSLLRFMSIESVTLSNQLILCDHLLLLPSIFPSQSPFQWVSSWHQGAKGLELQLQHQSFQWIFRVDFL